MRETFTSVMSKGPERFNIEGDIAAIQAEKRDLQQIVDNLKAWLPIANRQYAQTIRSEQLEEQERQRGELQREIEEVERQRRVRANMKI